MFTTNQIISATQMIKNFSRLARRLKQKPEALLIAQKSGNYLVLVNAEIFEDLMHFRYEATAAGFQGSAKWGEKQPI